MSSARFKQDIYGQLARVARAIGHPNRLELLEFVAQGRRPVDELAAMTRLSVANAKGEKDALDDAGRAAEMRRVQGIIDQTCR